MMLHNRLWILVRISYQILVIVKVFRKSYSMPWQRPKITRTTRPPNSLMLDMEAPWELESETNKIVCSNKILRGSMPDRRPSTPEASSEGGTKTWSSSRTSEKPRRLTSWNSTQRKSRQTESSWWTIRSQKKDWFTRIKEWLTEKRKNFIDLRMNRAWDHKGGRARASETIPTSTGSSRSSSRNPWWSTSAKSLASSGRRFLTRSTTPQLPSRSWKSAGRWLCWSTTGASRSPTDIPKCASWGTCCWSPANANKSTTKSESTCSSSRSHPSASNECSDLPRPPNPAMLTSSYLITKMNHWAPQKIMLEMTPIFVACSKVLKSRNYPLRSRNNSLTWWSSSKRCSSSSISIFR